MLLYFCCICNNLFLNELGANCVFFRILNDNNRLLLIMQNELLHLSGVFVFLYGKYAHHFLLVRPVFSKLPAAHKQ